MPPLALSEVVLEFFEAAAAPSGEGGEGGYRGQQHGVRDGARRVAALADQGAFSTLQVGDRPFLGRKDWCDISYLVMRHAHRGAEEGNVSP